MVQFNVSNAKNTFYFKIATFNIHVICNDLHTREDCLPKPQLKMLFNWKKGLAIKRTFFGHPDIRNSSLSVEKYVRKAHINFNTIFLISKWPCDVLFIIQTPMKYQTIFLLYIFCHKGCNLLWNHGNGDFFTCEDIMILQKISTDISLVFT